MIATYGNRRKDKAKVKLGIVTTRFKVRLLKVTKKAKKDWQKSKKSK
jgi:hypothetical protein